VPTGSGRWSGSGGSGRSRLAGRSTSSASTQRTGAAARRIGVAALKYVEALGRGGKCVVQVGPRRCLVTSLPVVARPYRHRTAGSCCGGEFGADSRSERARFAQFDCKPGLLRWPRSGAAPSLRSRCVPSPMRGSGCKWGALFEPWCRRKFV
jgi:hypothetical protein